MNSKKKDWKKKRRFRQALARILQELVNNQPLSVPYTGMLNTIAILAQEKYGDAILLTPLLKNLKKEFPDTEIHLITFNKTITEFFSTDSNVAAIHYAKGNLISYLKGIFCQKFDVLFNTKDHPSTSFLIHSLLIRACYRVGIDNEFHRKLYNYLIDIDYHSPVALKNCGLMTILGKPVPAESCRPYVPLKPVSEKITQFLETPGLEGAIGINISAGGATRHWTEDNWKAIINTFPEQKIVILSSLNDLDAKQKLEHTCSTILVSPPTTNLYEAGLIVDRLLLLVTPDTSMVHIASCFNTPVVGLYGKARQDRSRFKPFMVDYRMIVSPTALVRDIPLDEVTDIFREFLELRKRKASQGRHKEQ